MNRINSLVLSSAIALLVTACGGGGGSGGAPAPATPAAPASAANGQSVGAVTGFGSIFVNGIEFDTRQASFSKNGQSALEHDMKVGQIVSVTGTRSADHKTGTATQVSMKSNVEGVITNVDVKNLQITVLGQRVQLDASTVVEGATPADINGLAKDDKVEVSGLPDANGVILATHIEKVTTLPASLELRGVVASLDSGAKKFNIGTQVVDYSNATLVGFATTAIAEGDKVEVRGPAPANGAALAATRVEKEEKRVAGNEGAESELEGLITRFVSPQDFDVAGQKVTTNDKTRFERGGAGDLKMGARVEAEGKVDANGVLVAAKIEVKAASKTRVAGKIDTLNTTDKQFTVLGQVIAVDAKTQFEDKSSAHKMPFSFADLVANDFVVVRGVPGTGSVHILATRVERQNADAQTRMEVRGKVTEMTKPTFVVTGVTVTVDAKTRIEVDDKILSLDELFAQLKVGDQIEAKGTVTGAKAITASEVETDR